MSNPQPYLRGGNIRAEAIPFAPMAQPSTGADSMLKAIDAPGEYYSLPHDPFMPPPTPEPGSTAFTAGGVRLSPINEYHDFDKTPRPSTFQFQDQVGQDGHKRVVSDTGSVSVPYSLSRSLLMFQQPLQYSGRFSELQRPRSRSDAPLAKQSPSFDYQEARIWNEHSVNHLRDHSSDHSSVASPSPIRASLTHTLHQRSPSHGLKAGNGALESPHNVSAHTWMSVPNEITPTKQQNAQNIQQNAASQDSNSSQRSVGSQDMTPWRIPQRREVTAQELQGEASASSYQGNDIVRIMSGAAGLKITTSPAGSSVQLSTGSSGSPNKPETLPIVSSGGMAASYQPGEEKQRRAREFAAMIKAGMLDNRSGSRQSSGFSDGSAVFPTPPQFYQQMHPIPAVGQIVPPQIDALVAYFRSNNGASYEEMVNNMPLEDKCIIHAPVQSGVVHIADIPYSTTRQEIVAFFGRNARFVHQPANSPHYAIHIIMERSTGKSMDCFVEFQTPEDASIAAKRFNKQTRGPGSGRGPRLGNRSVRVEVVDQGVMMKELFPRAKYVEWHGASPVIQAPPNLGGFVSSGFQGFVTNEEMHMTVKLSADPKRSKYTSNHVQRTYESMISLLSKYPWHATQCYTLGERDLIFRSTLSVIGELVGQVQRGQSSEVLSPQLLAELLLVAHNCPGFSDCQRAQIVDRTCHLTGAPPIPLTDLALVSPFQRLTKKLSVSDELMKYLAQLLSQGTTGEDDTSSMQQDLDNPFGAFAVFPPGFDVSALTMFDAGNCEWSTIDAILQNTLHHAQA